MKKMTDKEKYEKLAIDFNQLVREHNTLVDQHGKLNEDARALLKMIEDIRLALSVPATKGIGLAKPGKIQKQMLVEYDESEQFCIHFHNTLVQFFHLAKESKDISGSCEKWRKEELTKRHTTIITGR